MPKLIYLGGGHHVSYRTDPHTVFQPSDDDARPHADVPVSVGRVLVAEAPALYAWADGEPADEPASVPPAGDGGGTEPEAPKAKGSRKAKGA